MGIRERKKREFDRREAEILKAAFNLFYEQDLDAVTIEMIAERAEIGKGTVYKHFKSKDEIYVALFIEHSKMITKELEGLDKNLTIEEQLRSVIQTLCLFCVHNPKEHSVFHQCEQKYSFDNLGPEMRERISNQIQKKMTLIGTLIQQGIEEGVIINKPVIQITAISAAMLEGISHLLTRSFIRDMIDDPKELIQLMEDTLIRGFRVN